MDPTKDRPDLEGNEAANTGGAPAGGMTGAATGFGAAVAAAGDEGYQRHDEADTKTEVVGERGSDFIEEQTGFVPYAAAGREFTSWFNGMLSRTTNPVLRLGTKTARVEALHDDGRLEVTVEGEGGRGEQQFLAFNAAQHLGALLLKFTGAARSA